MKLGNRLLVVGGIIVMSSMTVQAQFLKKLGNAVEDAAKNATVRKAEQKTDEAVSKSIDKATDPNSYKKDEKSKNNNSNSSSNSKTSSGKNSSESSGEENENASEGKSTAATAPQGAKAAEMVYAKSDFVPGDEVIFDDNQANEQMGEFPSQWDLLRGNAEIASIDGKKAILMAGQDSWLEPLMKTKKNYLGDVFTLEFDYFQPKEENASGGCELDFMGPNDPRDNDVFTITWRNGMYNGDKDIYYGWKNSSGRSSGTFTVKPAVGQWNHFAVSFNKRALKVYFNGNRIANVPNVSYPPGWVTIWTGNGTVNKDTYIKDVRIAKGAVPLYDRLASDGKIISYGITFDVGKSTIKPESMGEINRIAKLMQENADVKFSVEGHTDNTGNAASNQTLSEARSKAVMDKLVELGISKDRLKSAGKGQTAPIADNSTDEGRAKNRRVEFVKIK